MNMAIAASRPFHGWCMVPAAHVLFALCFGTMYSFGVFFEHIQDSFQVGRFSVSATFSITAFVYYLVGMFSGALADRFSVSKIVFVGVALLALGFSIASLTDSLYGLLMSYCALVGVGVGLVYVPEITVVQRWFLRQRSRASGLALAGTGVGTFVGPVAEGILLQHLSWRSTMQCFAVVISILGLGTAAMLVGKPAQVGQHPDGDMQPLATAITEMVSTSLRQALTSSVFWWYFAAIFLTLIGLFTALVHLNPYAQTAGVLATQGPVLVGLIGVGNVMGRLLLGGLGDRIGSLRLLQALTLTLAALPILWWRANGFWSLALFAILFGTAHGGCISLYPTVDVIWFGTRYLGTALGALYVRVGFAALLGASVSACVFDYSQSYSMPILGSGFAALLAAECLRQAGVGVNLYPNFN